MPHLTPAPRPVPTREDRMTEARTGPSFAIYLDRQERDQLDARAATAEQERDDALDDRDNARAERDVYKAQVANLREQLDRANTGRQRVQEQLADMTTTAASYLDERDRLAVLLDQTRAGLRVALYHVDANVTLAPGTRRYVEREQELGGCRIALQEATQAVEGVPAAAAPVPSRRAQGPRPGQFCAAHFSWCAPAGQGRCQAEATP